MMAQIAGYETISLSAIPMTTIMAFESSGWWIFLKNLSTAGFEAPGMANLKIWRDTRRMHGIPSLTMPSRTR